MTDWDTPGKEEKIKRIIAVHLLLLVLLSSCGSQAASATPTPRWGSAARPTVGPVTPGPPSPTPWPTPSIWLGWKSSDDNIALKKPVRVSHASFGHAGVLAVDGDPRTLWSSGAGPTQWIEIDLEQAYDIAEIRLIPAMVRPGVTIHQVLGAGPLSGGFQELCTFNSQVSDSPLLAYANSTAWQNIRIIRIETTFSPEMIGWKEVQIFRAE